MGARGAGHGAAARVSEVADSPPRFDVVHEPGFVAFDDNYDRGSVWEGQGWGDVIVADGCV